MTHMHLGMILEIIGKKKAKTQMLLTDLTQQLIEISFCD